MHYFVDASPLQSLAYGMGASKDQSNDPSENCHISLLRRERAATLTLDSGLGCQAKPE